MNKMVETNSSLNPSIFSKLSKWIRNHLTLSITILVLIGIVVLIITVLVTGKQITVGGLKLNPLVNKAQCPIADPNTCLPIDTTPIAVEGTLANGAVGQAYSQALSLSGSPNIPCAWTLTSVVPAMASAAIVGGGGSIPLATFTATPTTAGSYQVTIKVVCQRGQETTKTLPWTVVTGGSGETISISGSFANATVGQAYSQALSLSGSPNIPCAWTLTSVVPAMASAAIVGGGGSIPLATFTATPTTAGSYQVTIKVVCQRGQETTKTLPWTVVTGGSGGGGSGGGGTTNSACTDSSFANKRIAIHRFWKAGDTDHFFTTNANERPIGYTYEGIAGYVFNEQVSGTTPIYRSYSSINRAHYYSTVNDATSYNYANEGIIGYAYANSATGSVPWFRLHKGYPFNDYLETISSTEKIAAIGIGYIDAGVVANICGPDRPQ